MKKLKLDIFNFDEGNKSIPENIEEIIDKIEEHIPLPSHIAPIYPIEIKKFLNIIGNYNFNIEEDIKINKDNFTEKYNSPIGIVLGYAGDVDNQTKVGITNVVLTEEEALGFAERIISLYKDMNKDLRPKTLIVHEYIPGETDIATEGFFTTLKSELEKGIKENNLPLENVIYLNYSVSE